METARAFFVGASEPLQLRFGDLLIRQYLKPTTAIHALGKARRGMTNSALPVKEQIVFIVVQNRKQFHLTQQKFSPAAHMSAGAVLLSPV